MYRTLSNDYEAVSRSINSGKPIVLNGNSKYSQDMKGLGAQVTGIRGKGGQAAAFRPLSSALQPRVQGPEGATNMTANPNSVPPGSGARPEGAPALGEASRGGPAGAACSPARPNRRDPLHGAKAPAPRPVRHYFQQVKSRVHRRLIERLNLSNLERVSREQVIEAIRQVVHDLITQEMVPLNFEERELLVSQVLDEIFGLGPLEPLIQDPEISDILVNTYKQVFIERNGRLEKTDVRFQDDRHLLQVIDRIVSAVGRRIDDSSPMVDARLPDGSRVNAIIKPLALDGPHLSIRKFKRDALAAEDLIRFESADRADARAAARHREGAAQRADLGRHRRRQDDAAQHPLVLHSADRANRHHRGLGRAPAPPAARGPAGDPARPTSRGRARCRSGCC